MGFAREWRRVAVASFSMGRGLFHVWAMLEAFPDGIGEAVRCRTHARSSKRLTDWARTLLNSQLPGYFSALASMGAVRHVICEPSGRQMLYEAL